MLYYIQCNRLIQEKDDKIDGVVWFKGGVKFFTSSAVCTNGTAENEATMVYFGQEGSSNLYYYNGVGEPVKALAAGEACGRNSGC